MHGNKSDIKITAVLITKNEEGRIVPCLESLKWADEIVVVDDCSTDRTAEICREYKAKVIINNSGEKFSQQRNLAMANAANDWVLQMDADEIVPKETVKEIQKAVQMPGEYVAFKLKRKNFFLGYPLRYAGAYGYMEKLLNKNYASYEGNVHEIPQLQGKTGIIDADIHHFPVNSIGELINKANFYTDIKSRDFLQKKGRPSFRQIKYRLTWKSLKLFWKLYFKKQGYRDGMHGLAWCILNVIGPQIYWLKIWEKALKEDKPDG